MASRVLAREYSDEAQSHSDGEHSDEQHQRSKTGLRNKVGIIALVTLLCGNLAVTISNAYHLTGVSSKGIVVSNGHVESTGKAKKHVDLAEIADLPVQLLARMDGITFEDGADPPVIHHGKVQSFTYLGPRGAQFQHHLVIQTYDGNVFRFGNEEVTIEHAQGRQGKKNTLTKKYAELASDSARRLRGVSYHAPAPSYRPPPAPSYKPSSRSYKSGGTYDGGADWDDDDDVYSGGGGYASDDRLWVGLVVIGVTCVAGVMCA